MKDSDILCIHKALHSNEASVTVDGIEYNITKNDKKCRMVTVQGINFVVQNLKTGTRFAKMAKNGDRITWMANGKRWGRIVNDKIEIPCSVVPVPDKSQTTTVIRSRSKTQRTRRRVSNPNQSQANLDHKNIVDITNVHQHQSDIPKEHIKNTDIKIIDQTTIKISETNLQSDIGKIDEETALKIHSAIHDKNQDFVEIENKRFPIQLSSTGCRQCIVNGCPFVSQNPKKGTKWAKLAKKGHKITWITVGRAWGLIIDESIERRCIALKSKQEEKENTTEIRSRRDSSKRRRRAFVRTTS